MKKIKILMVSIICIVTMLLISNCMVGLATGMSDFTNNITLYSEVEARTITTVSDGGETFVVNAYGVDDGNVIILALYNGEQLLETQTALCLYGEATFITDKTYDTAKVMVWESLRSLVPVTKPESVNLSATPNAGTPYGISFKTERINMTRSNWTNNAGTLFIYTDETSETSKRYYIDIEKVYLNGREDEDLLNSIDTFLNNSAEADIKLVDNDGDGTYEIAYVTAYLDYVVAGKYDRIYRLVGEMAPSHPLLGTWPQRLILDEENEDYTFQIIKNGEVVDFSAIQEGDVLSIAGGRASDVISSASYDLAFGTVVVSSETVTGMISGIDTDNKTLYIDGVPYLYNNFIHSLLTSTHPLLGLGDECIFYINARGIICGLEDISAVSKLRYGFVTVAMETSGLTGNTMEFRMMDAEGVWNTYELAKNFDLNGATGTIAEFKAFGDISASNYRYVYNKLVAYELNSDGEVDNIYIIPGTDENFVSDGNYVEKEYNANLSMYNGKILTEDTKIFALPVMVSSSVAVDEEDVEVVTKDVLVDRMSYTMTAYNTNEDGEVPVLVGYGITGRINWADDFMIISKTTTGQNEEGCWGVFLTGLAGGEEVTVFSSTEVDGANVYDVAYNGTTVGEGAICLGKSGIIKKGDVICYSVNSKGEAAKIIRIQDAATIDGCIDNNNFDNTAVRLGCVDVAGTTYTYYLGYVNEVRSTMITIQNDMTASPTDEAILTLKDNSVVTEINTNYVAGTKVLVGDKGSILADSGLMVGDGSDNNGDIVLVKAINDVVIKEAVVYANERMTYVEEGDAAPELTFATEDINEYNTDISAGEIVVDNEGLKRYYFDIEKVYLNGKENSEFLSSIDTFLNSEADAEVTLVDSNDDGTYEVAYVSAHMDYVVDSVNADNCSITGVAAPSHPLLGTWPQTLILDEENGDYTFEIIKDGAVADFSAVQEGDVLSITGGLNADNLAFGVVKISSNTINGIISRIRTFDKTMYINGVPYPYNSTIETMIEKELLRYDDEATFCINAYGQICWVVEMPPRLQYGFVTVATESTSLMSETMEFRMMDAEGVWNTYELAENFELDGVEGTIANFKVLGDNTVNAVKYIYNKLVAYKLNSNGEVDSIYITPEWGTDFAFDGNCADKYYNAAVEMYNGKILTEDTKIFALPAMVSSSVAVDEEDVEVVTKDVLVDRMSYTMTAYNTNDDGEVPVFVGYGITDRINWADDFMIISKKTTGRNEDGEVGVFLTGLINGEEVTIFASIEADGANVYPMTSDGWNISEGSSIGKASVLCKGDVIIYRTKSSGKVTGIIRIQDAATIDGYIDNSSFANAVVRLGCVDVAGTTYTYYLGYVNEVRSKRITIQENMTGDAYDATALVLIDDSVVTEINTNHVAGTKVLVGDIGSFLADTGIIAGPIDHDLNPYTPPIVVPDNNGDIVLVKAINDVVIKEAVVYVGNQE